jgi:hypothetical protein
LDHGSFTASSTFEPVSFFLAVTAARKDGLAAELLLKRMSRLFAKTRDERGDYCHSIHTKGEQDMSTLRQFARLSVLSIVALLGVLAWPAAAAETLSADELASLLDKEVTTKADHLKLADHYTAEAAEFQKKAARHSSLAARYKAQLPGPKGGPSDLGMPRHCTNLSKALTTAAKESEQLAEVHRAMAAESK